MSVTLTTADTVYSTGNASILSVSNFSELDTPAVQASSLLSVYDYIFRSAPNETSTDSINQLLIYITSALLVDSSSTPSTGDVSLQNLRAFLVEPLLLFNPAGAFGGSVAPPELEEFPGLTPTATVGQSVNRIVISRWTVIFFTAVSGAIYVWCISSLLWAMANRSLATTSFPLLDFAARVSSGHPSVGTTLATIPLSSGGFRQNLQSKVVFLGAVTSTREYQGFLHEEGHMDYGEDGVWASDNDGFAWNKRHMKGLYGI